MHGKTAHYCVIADMQNIMLHRQGSVSANVQRHGKTAHHCVIAGMQRLLHWQGSALLMTTCYSMGANTRKVYMTVQPHWNANMQTQRALNTNK